MENQFAHLSAESDVDRLAQITCEELAEPNSTPHDEIDKKLDDCSWFSEHII